jgi:hypothetical protein
MNKKTAKKLRKLIRSYNPDVLLAIRNDVGDKTTTMEEPTMYRNAKRLYREGKIKISK